MSEAIQDDDDYIQNTIPGEYEYQDDCIDEAEHMDSPLPKVVQWLKTMTTNEYIRNVNMDHWPRFNNKLWQRSYYDHIIRSDESYLKLVGYIRNNPKKWYLDKLNPKK